MVAVAEADGGGVRFVVRDGGPGFPVHVIAESADGGVAPSRSGLGLGLVLVRRIAAAHGGRLVLENGAEGARAVLEVRGGGRG